MEDLIRRSDAIDALGEEPEVWEDDDEYGMGQRSEWFCRNCGADMRGENDD